MNSSIHYFYKYKHLLKFILALFLILLIITEPLISLVSLYAGPKVELCENPTEGDGSEREATDKKTKKDSKFFYIDQLSSVYTLETRTQNCLTHKILLGADLEVLLPPPKTC